MISALAALAIVSSNTTLNFTPPPPGTKTYSLGDSGTTLNRVDISWKWEKQASEAMRLSSLTCDKLCTGQKHFRHQDCDTSCDIKCASAHREDKGPEWQPATQVGGGPTLETALSQFGLDQQVASSIEHTSYVSSGINDVLQDPKLRAKWNLSCWNDDPCTVSVCTMEEDEYAISIEVRLYRITIIGDSELRTNGPTVHMVASVFFLKPETISETTKSIRCGCDIVTKEEHSSVPTLVLPQTAVTIKEPDGDTRVATGQEVKDMGFQVVANDMNHATFTMTGTCGNASEVCIPAGWELDCTDGSAQDTLLVQDLRFPIMPPPPPALLATILPTPEMAQPAKLDALTMCLEIEKKEPNSKLKYKLVPPSNQARVLSARLAADNRRASIATQVRTWIITDNASYDAIAKLLVPVPSPAMYIRELHNAKKIGAINPIEKKVATIYSNDLLTTPGLEPEAMDDFVKVKLNYDREATLKWIATSAGKSWAEWFESVAPSTVAPAFDQFIGRFANSGDAALLALTQMLASKELAPHIESIKGETMGSLAARLLQPCDAKLAEAIVVALEKTKSPAAKFALLNLDKSISGSLRARLSSIE